MNRQTNMSALVREALAKHEALTAYEISRITGVPNETVAGIISKLRSLGKPIRIVDWTHEQKAIRLHMVAVYSMGDGLRDVKRPRPMTNQERCARYARRKKRVASVWELAHAA